MTRLRLVSVAMVVAVLLSTIALPVTADVSTMAGNFLGQYFSNPYLTGSPTMTRSDPSINFNWGNGSPDVSIPPDFFSVRWTGTIPLAVGGNYTFSVTTDDGSRLWVDGVLLIDSWYDQPATTYQAPMALTAGAHNIRLEYYEAAGQATVALSWGLAGTSETYFGEYWNNIALSGPPALTRIDPTIDFNWGYGSPDPAIQPDYFSARWTGTFNFPTDTDYDLHMLVDDGGQLFLDGILVIDHWYPQAPTEYSVTLHITAGPHEVRMQYFEEAGIAVAKVWWNVSSGGGSPLDVIVDDLDPGFTKSGYFYQANIGYLNHIFYTRNAKTVQEYWGRWTPSLTTPGQYEVFVFVPNNYGTTHNARYSIKHAGLWNTVAVNQYIYYNVWVSLGTYQFNAAGDEFVFLNDVTYEAYLTRYVAYDAVKFSYRGP
jgi:hypothetical protein